MITFGKFACLSMTLAACSKGGTERGIEPAWSIDGHHQSNSSMARSKTTFNKRELENKRIKKREDKQLKKEERKSASPGGGLDNMIAYVDENGVISSTPPDPTKRKEVDVESIELGVPRRMEDDPNAIRTGRVDYFDHAKGFGFIVEQGSQERYFVHVSGLEEEVKEGNTVTYDLERGPKGMNAVRVKKI